MAVRLTDEATAAVWRCGRHDMSLGRPLVMGILNVTPDSFSDGGRHSDPISALVHGRGLIAAGADIVDIGGESTRPGSEEVPPAEELVRVRPIVVALARDYDLPISIDTRHADVAQACVQAGASVINDVSGFRDPRMVEVAAGCDAGVIVMHMLGEPKTMQRAPRYDNLIAEVCEFLAIQAGALEDAGIARERIAVDPGIGFGKTTAHNVEILQRLDEIAALGYPVVLGASRKRFIGEITGQDTASKRVGGSVAAALWGAIRGAAVLRVHDVEETVQALATWHSLNGGAA